MNGTRACVGFVLAAELLSAGAMADSFGIGDNHFEIKFVQIGSPGNPRDFTSQSFSGSVPYVYRMGMFEVPESAVNFAIASSAEEGQPLDIVIDQRGPNKPAAGASWAEVAKFVNWLNTSTGNSPAYKFSTNGDVQVWGAEDAGYDSSNPTRNKRAHYFLPSADEWYKAAYYNPDGDNYFEFPTGSDVVPIAVASGNQTGTAVYDQSLRDPAEVDMAGGLSPFGTMGQGGNVWEWLESPVTEYTRGYFGAGWGSVVSDALSRHGAIVPSLPTLRNYKVGFRVASIPEPSSAILFFSLFGSVLLQAVSYRKFQ